MYQPNDKFARQAKDLGYLARSVFKLQEIDRKFGVFRPNMKILDLGAAPGSWLQYLSRKIGSGGRAYGVDLTEIKNLKLGNIKTFAVDAFNEEFFFKNFLNIEFDAVISDMAPSTSGVKFADAALSLELLDRAFGIAQKYLKAGGWFIGKVFESHELNLWFTRLRKHFQSVRRFKPKACREESKELYVIGQGFKK